MSAVLYIPAANSMGLLPRDALCAMHSRGIAIVSRPSGATEFAGQENAGLENDGQKLQGLENDGQTIKVSYVELHNLTLLSRKYWTQVVIES